MNAILVGTMTALFLLSFALQAENLPRPEHPRPDFHRGNWLNLNGRWKFSFDPDDVGETQRWFVPSAHNYEGKIVVPFPWESKLSGIGDSGYQGVAWYEREFDVPDSFRGQRVILKFGAVDWSAKVWVNGEPVGEHEGGYIPFEFDITELVELGEKSVVTVRALDRTTSEQPTGKQTGWYTRTSGIWQTVYLEARSTTYIQEVHITPDLKNSLARFDIKIESDTTQRAKIIIETDADEKETARFDKVEYRLKLTKGVSSHTINVSIPNPKLWSPDEPNLYFVRLSLIDDNGSTDRLHTYFGMREISIAPLPGHDFQYIHLNGRPIYLRGALDQSFHPDGIYTFPSDDVARMDIARAKEFGLNFLRIHIKIEEPRMLYWADRLGLLLMCDMPNFSRLTGKSKVRYEAMLRGAVKRDFNHPSIFSWCLFNETWGLPMKQESCQRWVSKMYDLAKSLDPTRLVEDNSPCRYDHVKTDINSWHFYINDYANARDHIVHIVKNTYPGSKFNFIGVHRQANQPLINSEYGGISASAGDQDISWCFKYLTDELRRHAKIGGYVYTELMDIEWEHNGFMNYDRTAKEFGYGAMSLGFKLSDLNNPDFLIIDSDPCPTREFGSTFQVDVSFSHFSGRKIGNALLCWQLDGWDRFGKHHKGIATGRKEFVPKMWDVQKIASLSVPLPKEPMVAVLSCWVEDSGAKVVSRNYVNIDIYEGQSPRREYLSEKDCLFRWGPDEISSSSWIESLLEGTTQPHKVFGRRAGYMEYRLKLPKAIDVDAITGAEFIFELAAKAGHEKVEWPRYKPVDYPQTDRTKYPTDVIISINGNEVKRLTLPDDPADARGVLSHRARFHPGSYGYLTKVKVEQDVLSEIIPQLRDKRELVLRLEVPTDAEHVGGLAIFGEQLGRYPLDPTLILHSEKPLNRAAVIGDGSSIAISTINIHTAIATAEGEGQEWRYTTDKPSAGWELPNFDDSDWKIGISGLGRHGTPNTHVRTEWLTSDIWMRKSFTLQSIPVGALLRYYHDEDMEVYLNGQCVLERKGYIVNYQDHCLSSDALKLLRKGKNILALHCHQTVGGQYADVGVIVME